MPTALVSLGSNLADRRKNLAAAVDLLKSAPHTRVLATSAWRESPPAGGPAGQGPYLNGAARLETTLAPRDLLAFLQDIEQRLGRTRLVHWGPRTIDLDLLLYDDLVLRTPDLTLPHPRMAWRRFVLEPAAEIAGEMPHPTSGLTIAELLAHSNGAADYVAITGPPGIGKTRLAADLAAQFSGRPIADNPPSHSAATDPAGPTWDIEIEFLQRRRKLLQRATWPDAGTLAISDFWFGQSLLYASVRLGASEFNEYSPQWHAARLLVVAPKLLVLLETPGDAGDGLGRPSHDKRDDQHFAKSLKEIVKTAEAPVLTVSSADPMGARAEIAAAIEAMR